MSQTSIASYFATRKRPATDDANIIRAKKVFVLDPSDDIKGTKGVIQPADNNTTCDVVFQKELSLNNNEAVEGLIVDTHAEKELIFTQRNRVVTKLNFESVKSTNNTMTIKKAGTPKSKPKKIIREIQNQPNIQSMFNNIQQNKNSQNTQEINEKTPPTSPVKNALDSFKPKNEDLSLNEIKNKLTRSSRLAELKASLSRFNKNAEKLKEIEKKTATITSPSLKTFKTIDIEVQLSPKKIASPVKQYLSPRKDVSSPRKNLMGLLSPVKHLSCGLTTSPAKAPAYQRFQALASPGKPSLTLPFKYRSLAEVFRSIDTVCAMLFNRKETITMNKLKPAVQEMMRRNLTQQHFAQIKTLYPDAFTCSWEKMKSFGLKQEQCEFVIAPTVKAEKGSEPTMNPTCLLDRRRKLFNALIERVKNYHNEFLMSLDPPMVIPRDKITRWHPEFDIEKVPDIEEAEMPPQPEEEKMTTGKEVLEKARNLFSCNTRMEKALEKLKQLQDSKPVAEEPIKSAPVAPNLKGIPKALLEKIRAKQAAKALEAMTRSDSQDKDALMYSRLPDIARLLRNTFVAEKKGVLPLEELVVKLNNSYRSFLSNADIEEHLRLISKVVPGWLVFHEVRKTLFVKVSRDGDMGKVLKRLEALAKEKSGA